MTYDVSPTSLTIAEAFLVRNLASQTSRQGSPLNFTTHQEPWLTWPFERKYNKTYRGSANLWSWMSRVRIPSLTPLFAGGSSRFLDSCSGLTGQPRFAISIDSVPIGECPVVTDWGS